MDVIKAPMGKRFKSITGNNEKPFYATKLVLSEYDSIDNYEEVDESEYEAYLEEQKKKAQEEELHRLLREMYPEESSSTTE